MGQKKYPVNGKVKIFDVVNPWIYVGVSKTYTRKFKALADRGLIPITAVVGKSSWKTSLMPKGDGTHFIPLPAKVRKAEGIKVGGTIKLSFQLRDR